MLAATLALLFTLVTAAPQVSFPLDLQYPPIARISEPYSFQFAPTTFQPNPDKLQYSLVGSPSWLHIYSGNRTIWGNPGINDVGITTFTIAAAGEAGAVANLHSKILVREDEGPRVSGNMSQKLSSTGQLCGSKAVTVLPSKPFEINFTMDTFQANGMPLKYHATLADHTPLPALRQRPLFSPLTLSLLLQIHRVLRRHRSCSLLLSATISYCLNP
jgi:hypothetical protein